MKRPLTPAGAEKVTSVPGTGFLSVSVTVTARRIGNTLPVGADWVEPTPGAILAGLPARFTSEKSTGATTGAWVSSGLSAPPAPAFELPPEIEAVATNEPASVVAVRGGELASPPAPVVAVAWVPPPAKVALAPGLALQRPAMPEPSVNVTVTPTTGLSPASTTRTRSGCAKRLPTSVELRSRGIAASRAGMPAAVLVSENETDPYGELAVTV